MTQSANTYPQSLLNERRAAQGKQIFRRRLGVLAVSGALAVPVVHAGGARPFAHDVINFAKDRVEMVKSAFDPSAAEQAKQNHNYLQNHPGQARVEQDIQQTIDQNQAAPAEQDH